MNLSRKLNLLIMGCALLVTSGCAALWPDETQTRQGASSSLVDFLYPKGVMPPEQTSKVRLEIPLRVGIGFVPGPDYQNVLTEQDRSELLQQVKAQFSELEYVQNIVVIPQTYLRGRDGLLAVEQIGRLYQLDVVGLVSYDQTLISESRKSSLLYWTILGAYVVKGSSNEVSTFVDLAVVDVRSKKLLLRAGGTHQDQQNSTLVDRSSEGRKSQINSFKGATADLLQNLSAELDNFEESIKSNDEINVVHKGSRSGSGSLVLELGFLLLLLCYRSVHRTRFALGKSQANRVDLLLQPQD